MIQTFVRRRLLAVVVASLLALAPLHTPAQAQSTAGGGTSQTVVGAIMAIGCGASARVATVVHEPIVIVVTVLLCAFMVVDAWATPDTPPA